MLIFLVPLKNRACSNDWDTVSRFCRSAIASMLANSQSHVVLICRDEPDGIEKSNNLTIHAIDAPTPTTPQEMMVDKYRKLAAGLELARSYAPCWLMRADADDLISNRIHPYIEGNPGPRAWYAETGWIHRSGPWLEKRRNFHKFCGTSCLTYVTPDELSEESYLLSQGHNIIVDYLKLRTNTRALPFPAAIYRLETGENWSGGGYKVGIREGAKLSLIHI